MEDALGTKVGARVTIYVTMIDPLLFDPCCLNITGLFQKKTVGLRSFSEPLSSHTPTPLLEFLGFLLYPWKSQIYKTKLPLKTSQN